MQFSQVVGIDLVLFNESGYDKILITALCWGTSYQMAKFIANGQSKTVTDGLAKM